MHDEGDAAELEFLRARNLELERTLASREVFIATLAHELRNPLSPIYLQVQIIIGAVEKAGDDGVAPSWLLPRLHGFNERLGRFLEMLNRLLEASHLEASAVNLQLETVDLVAVVRDVVTSMEREISAAQIPFTIEGAESVVGRWDRIRLEQIFRNLVANGIRYAAGKPMAVVVAADERLARITVRDEGMGIDSGDKLRLFGRFERGASAHGAGGFGLGLWVVWQLCHAMRGSIVVESEPGCGASFIVTLPRDSCSVGEGGQ